MTIKGNPRFQGASAKIREGEGQLQNVVVPAGAEIHLLHRVFEIAGTFRIKLAMGLHRPRFHRGIRAVRGFTEAFRLNRAGLDHAFADDEGLLACRTGRQFTEVLQWHFHVQVDPLYQNVR